MFHFHFFHKQNWEYHNLLSATVLPFVSKHHREEGREIRERMARPDFSFFFKCEIGLKHSLVSLIHSLKNQLPLFWSSSIRKQNVIHSFFYLVPYFTHILGHSHCNKPCISCKPVGGKWKNVSDIWWWMSRKQIKVMEQWNQKDVCLLKNSSPTDWEGFRGRGGGTPVPSEENNKTINFQ